MIPVIDVGAGGSTARRRLGSLAGVLIVLVLVGGCAVNRATAVLTPGSELTPLKTFYVVTFPPDKRGIDTLIRDRLVAMGYTATLGPEKPTPYDADAVVSYFDKWMWDMGMYMLELTIVLRSPTDNFPLASGNSLHTSLARKTPEEMVQEVLTNIFKAPKPGP
jgi:hypothetical protein